MPRSKMERVRLLALDTEDDSNSKVGIINFYDGVEHYTFTGDDCQLQAWNWLSNAGPAMVWCCNLEYDLINLCGAWIGLMTTMQYVTAGLMRATWNRSERVTFYDTLRHWPMSVEQMGRFLGLPKLKADFTSVKYCRRDTEIVWLFTAHMLKRYEADNLLLKATLPSMALQLFRSKFCKVLPRVEDHRRLFYRTGYYGGRVEVYRFKPVLGPVHHYDVNSLFPTQMRDGVFPDVDYWEENIPLDLEKWEGMAEVTIHVPFTRYPPLPMRYDGELVYPHGTMRGTWCFPEIREALADGAKILEVHRSIQHRRMKESPFKGFVEHCYSQRLQATHELDRVYWKLMMNSLYGKFAQREGMTMIHKDLMHEMSKPAGHANVIWSAYVTSHARVHLLRELRRCHTVYYTDTDSLFTDHVLETGKELGKLKLEGTYKLIEFIGNKLYVVLEPSSMREYQSSRGWVCPICHNDGKEGRCYHAKAKGVPRESAADFIHTGRAIFRRPARFREARKSLLANANTWYDVEKVRDDLYTKRIVLENGQTEPWEWEAYQIFRDTQRHGN